MTTPSDAAPPSPPAAAAPAPTAPPADEGSLFDGLSPPAAPAADPPAADTDTRPPRERIPEKYQVKLADGTLDVDASLAKLLDGHGALQKKLGAGPEIKSPADYKLELGDGVDVAAFTADPMFQDFAKEAHEKGLSNEQLNWAVGRYLKTAGDLIAADADLSVEEAKAELSKLWPEPSAFTAGLQSSLRAIGSYGGQADDAPGSKARLQAKFGRDPDFIAFSAAIGAELREDRPAADAMGISSGADIDALMKGEAYWKPEHPDHEKVKAKVTEFYAKQHGTKKR